MSLTLKQACRMVAKTRRRVWRMARRFGAPYIAAMDPGQLAVMMRYFAETAPDARAARALAAEWQRRKDTRDRLVVALAEQKWARLRARHVLPPEADRPVFVPPAVAVCPHCDGQLYLDVDEWESETGIPTETGTHIHCEHEPEDDPRDVHYQMPYVYWLPLHARVYPWVATHVRVVERLTGRTFGDTRTKTALEVL